MIGLPSILVRPSTLRKRAPPSVHGDQETFSSPAKICLQLLDIPVRLGGGPCVRFA